MHEPVFEDLGDGIYCIDALYTQPGLACCYLIGDGAQYALIETGTALSVPNILATLCALAIPPAALRYVIPTHVHLDHAGGAGALMQQFPEATLIIHPRGARHMIDPRRLVASAKQVYGETAFTQLYGEIVPIDEGRVQIADDGTHLSLGSRILRFIHTRGHADHHFCVHDEQSNGWFSGDMFGVSYPVLRFSTGAFVMPATTPTQFDPALYAESVRRLAASEPKRLYLTHFSALPFEGRQVESLCRQLTAYAELGRSGPKDQPELESLILEIARDELEQLVDSTQAKAAVGRLSIDATLNAQGIAWWQRSLDS